MVKLPHEKVDWMKIRGGLCGTKSQKDLKDEKKRAEAHERKVKERMDAIWKAVEVANTFDGLTFLESATQAYKQKYLFKTM